MGTAHSLPTLRSTSLKSATNLRLVRDLGPKNARRPQERIANHSVGAGRARPRGHTASGPLIRRQSPKCQGTSRNSDPSANAPGQGCRVAPPAIKTSAAKVKMVFAGPVARTQPNRGDALRRCRRPAILNRDGTTLVQPSSCVVLVRTCFPSWTATSLEDANLGKFPSDVPARPTPRRGGIRPHYAKAFR